jgi:acyl-CoA synthetase (AMP-forming)/AMP-acid ligase II
MIDLVDMVFFHADASPEKPAVITGDVILNYAMLRRGILSAEARLRQAGLKSGDSVAITVTNAIGHLTLICALYRAGIASVSVEPAQVESLDDLVVDAWLTSITAPAKTVRTIALDDTWFNDRSINVEQNRESKARDDAAACRLILSSGTTGRPKIIGLSYGAVRERLISYSIRVSTPSWDRLVCMPGLSTNYGFSFAITALWLGRTVCFSYGTTGRDAILAHQADLFVASTHQITSVVVDQEQQFLRLESLRSVHIGGSIAYAPLLARIRMLVCPNVFCGYGSTEGGTVAYAPAEAIYGMDRAVGIVAPWIELEVGNGDTVADYGREGQVRLRALGRGYRYSKIAPAQDQVAKDQIAHYQIDDSEWFDPGDQGLLFKNGLLAITGRVNEIINRGGVKVSPDAIEEEIKRHPIVADAAAVGILDQLGIEQIWVAVVARDGSEVDIRKMFDFCRDTMTLFVPDRIFQVPAIPRNALGKVARVTLTDQLKTQEKDLALTIR